MTEFDGPWFDQDPPERPITSLAAELDWSAAYELTACAVFRTEDKGWLIVYVSGCSCWPERGITEQTYAKTESERDKAIMEIAGSHALELIAQIATGSEE